MDFYQIHPTLENYWRSIILFGRNSASYKFALAKSLFDFKGRSNDLITLEELAVPFTSHLCEHLVTARKQTTSSSSRFLMACHEFTEERLDLESLIGVTTKLGFANVIDAFHVVNNQELDKRFFIDERKSNKGIRITDNLFQLFEVSKKDDLSKEVEARWRLVEHAWNIGVSSNLLQIHFDPEQQHVFSETSGRRVNITSCRDSLNGYQKGKCFYCFQGIDVTPGSESLCDVDHFFPWVLKGDIDNINGLWNLVLSCKSCNRGTSGKFAHLPSINLLARLHRRNEYLIASHLPIRETLLRQTGGSVLKRTGFLQNNFNIAKAALVHEWEPLERADPIF